MADLERWRGWTALVTGASSGIGAEVATRLAEAGCHLVLTARREEKLRALADELVERCGVEVEVLAADLARPGAAADLVEALEARGQTIDVLVNNAGVGLVGPFAQCEGEAQMAMLRLNVSTVVELTHRLLAGMLERGRGQVVLVGSLAGYLPLPQMALYAASKAFVGSFGEALAFELRGQPVGVTTIHPGGTRSEFSERAGMTLPAPIERGMMSSAAVAEIGLRAASRGRRSVVTGWLNVLTVFLLRFVPTGLLLRVGDAIYSRLGRSR